MLHWLQLFLGSGACVLGVKSFLQVKRLVVTLVVGVSDLVNLFILHHYYYYVTGYYLCKKIYIIYIYSNICIMHCGVGTGCFIFITFW